MAKALVKYETIGDSQIKDIMEGREPQPPEDWDDTPDSSEDEESPKPEAESKGSIGGPASEH
jgi:cell division protease FtsH